MTNVPPGAEDWGSECSGQERRTPTLHQVCNWSDWQAVAHRQLQNLRAPHFCYQNRVLWIVSLLQGGPVLPDNWNLGWSNAVSGWTSSIGEVRMNSFFRCAHPALRPQTQHCTIPVSSSPLGTVLHAPTAEEARQWQRARHRTPPLPTAVPRAGAAYRLPSGACGTVWVRMQEKTDMF